MDENLHELDDLFNKALNEHNEAPSENIWEKIEKDLEKQKVVSITKKYQRWKWVAAALFIFSFGMAMYNVNIRLRYKQEDRTNTLTARTSDVERLSAPRSTTDKETTLRDIVGEQEIAMGKNNIHQKGNVNKITDSLPEVAKIEKGAGLRSKKIESGSKLDRGGKEENNLVTSGRKNIRNIAKRGYAGEKSEANKLVINNGSASKIDSRGKLMIDDAVDRKNYDVNLSVVPLAQITARPGPIGADLKLAKKGSIRLSNAQSITAKAETIRGKIEKTFSASVYVSTDAVSNNLKNNSSRYREDDRREIKNAEKVGQAYTIGVTIAKRVSGKISILSGLSFSKRSIDIGTRPVIARPDGRGNINYRISSSSGYAYLSNRSGGVLMQGDSISALSSKSSLQYFSIPVGLQYHLTRNKFSLNPEVALIANFKTKAEISSLLKTVNGVETSASDNIMGLKSSYFVGSFKLNLGYNFTNNMALVMMPAWRFAISSATSDGPVKTYTNSLGLGLGLKFEF